MQQKVVFGIACTCVLAAEMAFSQITRLGGLRGNNNARRGSGASAGVEAASAGGATAGKKNRVEITRFPQPNKAAMVRTPEYGVNVQNTQNKVNSRPREWALFEIKYKTGARWADELTFTYHVMTKGVDDDMKAVYNYFTLSERYVNVPRGEHMSCVALPPSTVERYGQPVSLALVITDKEHGDEEPLASQSESTIPYPSKTWWKDPKVMDQPMVKRQSGLVDRSKTPFALINTDDYEVIQ